MKTVDEACRVIVAALVGSTIGWLVLSPAAGAGEGGWTRWATLFVGSLAVAAATTIPIETQFSRSGRLKLSLTEAPVVALALLTPAPVAMAASAAGMVALAVARREAHWWRRVGTLVVDLTVPLTVIPFLAGYRSGAEPWQVMIDGTVAGTLAGMIQFAVVVAVLTRASAPHPAGFLPFRGVLGCAVAAVGGASGAGIALATESSIAAGAAAVVALTCVILATWQRARALEQVSRWQRLATLAGESHEADDAVAVVEAVRSALDGIIDSHEPRVVDRLDADTAVAVTLGPDRWLTLHPVGHPAGLSAHDLAQLQATAQIANAAIDNLRLRDQLRTAAMTDPLTGVLNRGAFDRELAQRCARSTRDGQPFTLAIVDGDQLKRVNDTHGHQGGDLAIQFIATQLGAAVRAGDVVARLGGDEFAILAAGTADTEAVCERFATSLAAAESPLGRISASVGAAAYGIDADTPKDLFAIADRRMYEMKAASRG